MTLGPALPCPSCKRVLGPESWADAHQGSCARCKTEYELIAFPALYASATRIAAAPAVLAADSVCFFHAENRAEAICDDCGRLLCAVCTVPFAGRRICPTCIAASKSSEAAQVVRDRLLYDGLAISLALVPLLMWPFTLVTAPVAVGVAIYGWNKPASVVRGRSRVRLVIAIIAGLLQIAAWIALVLYFPWGEAARK